MFPRLRTRGGRLALLLVALLVATVPSAGAVIYPLEYDQSVADPAVVQVRPQRYVVVATGPEIVRGTSSDGRQWRIVDSALLTRPAWANPNPRADIWASDMVRLHRRWVLYFSVPVKGLDLSSRCIGVAIAGKPTGTFRPVGSRPLVCPPGTDAPPAADPMIDRGRRPTLPTIGAIDPSVYRNRRGVWLLYKSDGRPSSIRIVKLSPNGLDVAARSRQLVASSGVIENPALVKRGRWLYLFMSYGDYSRCSYETIYRRSRRLLSWTNSTAEPFLSREDTKLCGPGGADVLVRGTGARQQISLYFHAWVCNGTGLPCRDPFHSYQGQEDHRLPVRALYGVDVEFTRKNLAVRGTWIRKRG